MLIMAANRFRQFRGIRTRSQAFDGDTFDGTGQALKASFAEQDEGEARMMGLLEQLNEIAKRPVKGD
jgi:hypothetical protein